MTHLKVLASSITTQTREPASCDEWDWGSTSTDWSVDGISLTDSKYGDVTADFDVKPGDTLYLVYAIYSTGSSFGHAENSEIDYITVHKTAALAESNAKILREKEGGDNCDWTVHLSTDSGIVLPYSIPWLGYFEHLTGVYVESFTVKYRSS